MMKIIFALLFATTISATELTLETSEWIPYALAKNASEVTGGITVDIVKEAGRRANIKINIVLLPTKRYKEMFAKGEIDGEIAVDKAWRTDFKSVFTEPYLDVEDIILVRKDLGRSINSADDLKGMKVGGVAGYSYPKFEAAIKNKTFEYIPAPENNQLVQMMGSKRYDAIFVEKNVARYIMKQKNINPDEFNWSNSIGDFHVCIMLQEKHAPIIPLLNKALQEMIKDGTITKTIDKYLK